MRAKAEWEGQVILILHPGMDTGKSYSRIAARLANRYRVIRQHRRPYRFDLKKDPLRGSPCMVADEDKDVLVLIQTFGDPVFLFGHSSGATVTQIDLRTHNG